MVSFTAIVSALAAATFVAAAPLNERGGYSGQATWYTQNGNAGSCGNYNSDSALIVAMNEPMGNGHCGQQVKITNKSNGKTVTATVADLCPGCSYGSLDLSTGTFKAIGDLDTGVLPIEWYFV